jgi:5'-nucleotidase
MKMAAAKKPDILVTNDDGESEGLRLLLGVAREFGNAYAIVPNRQRSAVSGALTLHKPIRLHKAGRDSYSINGTPADCVLFARYSGEFPKPDLVLSGINMGDNTGMAAIFGSGTLGACWQAAMEGVPAAAFSIKMRRAEWHERKEWANRDAVARKTGEILQELLPQLVPGKFFNVNYPDALESAKIVYTSSIQRMKYDTRVTRRTDPDGTPYYWISGAARKAENGTDAYEVLHKGNIAITEISLQFLKGD